MKLSQLSDIINLVSERSALIDKIRLYRANSEPSVIINGATLPPFYAQWAADHLVAEVKKRIAEVEAQMISAGIVFDLPAPQVKGEIVGCGTTVSMPQPAAPAAPEAEPAAPAAPEAEPMPWDERLADPVPKAEPKNC